MQEIRKVLRMIGILTPKTEKLFGIVNFLVCTKQLVNDYYIIQYLYLRVMSFLKV